LTHGVSNLGHWKHEVLCLYLKGVKIGFGMERMPCGYVSQDWNLCLYPIWAFDLKDALRLMTPAPSSDRTVAIISNTRQGHIPWDADILRSETSSEPA
jgi:hypothetical protein